LSAHLLDAMKVTMTDHAVPVVIVTVAAAPRVGGVAIVLSVVGVVVSRQPPTARPHNG
jgi:hypothetical protein